MPDDLVTYLCLNTARADAIERYYLKIFKFNLEVTKMIFEEVVQILAEYKDMDPADIKPESDFRELGLDSLDTVEIVMSLEDKFDIEIEMNENLKTVADLVKMIEELK